ncbi:MAG: MFS transporter [Saccharothrix sp.]|nr:MFS transporter [Saccharothrix sp.]
MTARPHLTAVLLFVALGGQVGVWAASLPAVARELQLGPGALGLRLGVLALVSVVTVLATGRLADAHGRRGVAVAGLVLMAASYAVFLLGASPVFASFLVFAGYGVASGLLDLAANAVGSDLEAATGRKLMVGLHAGFSGGAAVGAASAALLAALGFGHHLVFAVVAALLLGAALWTAKAAFPSRHRDTAVEPTAKARSAGLFGLVGLVIALGTTCFFGDGVLQSFAPLHLDETIGAGAAGTAFGVALFHATSLAGRMAAVPVFSRVGNEIAVLVVCGAVAAASVLVVVVGATTWLALAGMAAAGLALSPVIPITYSLLGRSAGDNSGAAISVLAACSYGAFTAAPAVAGVLAEGVGLRAALVPAVCCYAGCAVLALVIRGRGRRETAATPGEEASCQEPFKR